MRSHLSVGYVRANFKLLGMQFVMPNVFERGNQLHELPIRSVSVYVHVLCLMSG